MSTHRIYRLLGAIGGMLVASPVCAIESLSPQADLVECRFAKAGELSLNEADAVAIFFPTGMKGTENTDASVVDPKGVLRNGIPRKVQFEADGGVVLSAHQGRALPFIALSNDARHLGDNYSAAMDFVSSEDESLMRLGFCIRFRNQEAIDRQARIWNEGESFGVRNP